MGGLVVVLAAGALVVSAFGHSASSAVAPPVPEPVPPPETAADLAARGDAALRDGQWQAALDAYAEASRLEPDLPAPHVHAAQALVFAHRYPEAIARAEQAVALAPRSSEAHAVLALAYNWNGDTVRALAEARRAAQLDPQNGVAPAYVAEALAHPVQLADADAAMHRGRSAAPDEAEVYRVSGYLQENQQDYGAAVDEYQRAIALRPRWAHLHVSQGHALRVLRRYDDAVEAFARAADLALVDPRPEGGLGMAYFD